MPQLNFAWWLMNFIIAWLTLAILITLISNKNIETNNITYPQPTAQLTNSNQWDWN
uniref:ATP synthase complex subunit 8 n=1 Tax=Luidia maculata TaxID=60584 RepID=A0A7M1ILE4_9ECHI|nr:ATP8 [Luidia maculata]